MPGKKTLDRLSRALRVTRAELLGSVPANPVVIEMELAQAQSDIEAGKLAEALRKLDSLLRRVLRLDQLGSGMQDPAGPGRGTLPGRRRGSRLGRARKPAGQHRADRYARQSPPDAVGLLPRGGRSRQGDRPGSGWP